MHTDSAVAVYDTHAEAETALKALSRSGVDMKTLSIIGKGYHTEEHALGFYTTGDRIKTWGRVGSFWGAIWGLLVGPAILLIPTVGLVVAAGPLVAALIAALEGAVVGGGLSAIAGALVGLGMSKDQAVKYEAAVKADRFLVLVHGSGEEVAKARAVLDSAASARPAGGSAVA